MLAVAHRADYSTLRTLFSVHSHYVKNALWASKSVHDTVILTNQDYRIVERERKLAHFWARVPVVRGRCVWLPIRFWKDQEPLLREGRMGRGPALA